VTPKHSRTRPPTRKHRKVGQPHAQPEIVPGAGDISVEISLDNTDIRARLDEIAGLLGGAEPLSVEEARRALGRIHGTKDLAELAADRAEALAQIQVAQATIDSLATPAGAVGAPPATPGPSRRRRERPGAEARERKRSEADQERIRRVARLAVGATVNLRQAEAAVERLPHPEPDLLSAAEEAQSEVESARSQLDPARRRTVGALISATGMVIVIATVGWPASVYLVPTSLVLLVTADMRVAGVAARRTRERLADRLTTAEAAGGADLATAQAQVASWQEACARRDDAARRHAEAWEAWEEVGPGKDPAEVEELFGAPAEPVADAPAPAPPDPATERARVMAEDLVEGATRELAMIAEAEGELQVRRRAELSLAWHEAASALGEG